MNTLEIEEELTSILRQYLSLVTEDEDIAPDSSLAELGLDSMNAVNLMLEIEEEFEVSFPDSMMNNETFYSVSTLGKAIRTLQEESGK